MAKEKSFSGFDSDGDDGGGGGGGGEEMNIEQRPKQTEKSK